MLDKINKQQKKHTRLAKEMIAIPKETADFLLSSTGVDPRIISQSNSLQTYYKNIVAYLDEQGLLKEYFQNIADDGYVFAKNLLKEGKL